jgi:Flp pilus assembly protein TadG
MPTGQRGAVAVEFAMVFTFMFGIFWLILSYSIPFFLYQVMSHATAETARSALRIDYKVETDSQIISLATTTLTNQLKVLPAYLSTEITPTVPVSIDNTTVAGQKVITVTLTYAGCNATTLRSSCIITPLNFGPLGNIPNLPAFTISARERLE